MKKCKYCKNKAAWLNPYTNDYYCEDHAKLKYINLIKELNDQSIETMKDLFFKVNKEDKHLSEKEFDIKTGEFK